MTEFEQKKKQCILCQKYISQNLNDVMTFILNFKVIFFFEHKQQIVESLRVPVKILECFQLLGPNKNREEFFKNVQKALVIVNKFEQELDIVTTRGYVL